MYMWSKIVPNFDFMQDSDYLRKRLHSKLMEIGILEKIDMGI